METHIRPALGNIKLSALNPTQIQHFYNELLESGRVVSKTENGKKKQEHAPLSAKSVKNIHGVLSKALSVAVNLGYIRDNPCNRVTLPRVERKEIRPLTDEQAALLIKEADGDPYGDIFKVIVFTGLRKAEATGLTWDNVDFERGQVTVSRQLQKRPKADGGFVFAPLKNDRVRVLTPAPYVMDVLRQHKVKQEKARLSYGENWEGWTTRKEMETALVFTTLTEGHLHPQTVYNHLKKLAAKIGAPYACVHDLRHTFAVLSLENGDDVKTVQDNLGHATAAFTLDVYGHSSERMRKESADRMQNFIENQKIG